MVANYKKFIISTLLTFSACLKASLGFCEQPLVFVSAPDMHNIEMFLYGSPPGKIAEFDFLLKNMAGFNPSFVLIPGDLGSQHWWETKYETICAPGGKLADVIHGCAAKTYPKLLSFMASRGVPNVYVGLGDHEIGDNNWQFGVKSTSVPFFKQNFAKYFTQSANGNSKFKGTINGVPMRPIGTAYEHTSYAFFAGNALFVFVDEFRQDNSNLFISRYGTVRAEVGVDGHLQWLDKLLAAARTQPALKHIIVVGHLPVLAPVRGQFSSMLFLEGWHNSAFWTLLRKYKVDVYLAGEVHQTSVNKDPGSNIFQIVNIGGCCKQGFSGFLVGRLYSDRLEFEEVVLQTNIDGTKSFIKEGTLVIDKSFGKFSYRVTGKKLKPIDPAGLIIHYSFDGDISKTVKNQGSLGNSYDASQTNIYLQAGVLNNAAWFGDRQSSAIKSNGINPIDGQRPRTISMWLRTASKSPAAYLYPSGQFWGTSTFGTNGFRLLLANGVLQLQIDAQTRLQADQGALKINDYKWHHVSVTYHRDWTLQKDKIQFYIDGLPYGAANSVTKTILTEIDSDRVIVGGRKSDQNIEGWTGMLDDVGVWSSALSPAMIKAVKSCALSLVYNASDMEMLLNLYRKQSGIALVKGLTWNFSPHVTGTEGVCTRQAGNSYSLKLDSTGRGVTAKLN